MPVSPLGGSPFGALLQDLQRQTASRAKVLLARDPDAPPPTHPDQVKGPLAALAEQMGLTGKPREKTETEKLADRLVSESAAISAKDAAMRKKQAEEKLKLLKMMAEMAKASGDPKMAKQVADQARELARELKSLARDVKGMATQPAPQSSAADTATSAAAADQLAQQAQQTQQAEPKPAEIGSIALERDPEAARPPTDSDRDGLLSDIRSMLKEIKKALQEVKQQAVDPRDEEMMKLFKEVEDDLASAFAELPEPAVNVTV